VNLRAVILAALVPFLASCRETSRDAPQATQETVRVSPAVEILAPLIDPAKLDTLKGKRAANRRLRLVCYHLETARRDGEDPAEVIDQAQESLGYAGTARADAVKGSLLRNLDILGKLGCLDDAGMAKLKTGNAPTVTKGPYAGDIASVDHIIPRSVCEELDERLYNLELLPSKLNQAKGNKVTLRQIQLARKWHAQGLLSDAGLDAVEAAQ
jgi:hypothetical protein